MVKRIMLASVPVRLLYIVSDTLLPESYSANLLLRKSDNVSLKGLVCHSKCDQALHGFRELNPILDVFEWALQNLGAQAYGIESITQLSWPVKGPSVVSRAVSSPIGLWRAHSDLGECCQAIWSCGGFIMATTAF